MEMNSIVILVLSVNTEANLAGKNILQRILHRFCKVISGKQQAIQS